MAGRQPAVGVAAKLVLWACSCGLALAADAVIYDSLEMTDLNFNVFPQNSQWTQVSFTNNSDVLSSMSVCAIGSGGNVSNWFRLPFMRAPDTDLLYIRLQFIMRDCSVVLQCKQVFGLLTRNANGSASSVPSWDQSASGYVLVQNVAADSTYRDSATATINTKEVQLPKNASSAGMFIAFHDQGTCVQIIRFVVLYKQCSQLVSNLVAFDKVPARSAPYAVTGRCVANAVPADSSAGSLSQICSHTGDWLQTFVPKCLCAAGYTPAGDGLSCSACGAGTFKMSSGNEQCSNCPPRSSSSATGAVSCPCNGGFYRALGEDGTVACTGPPSPVRSLTAAGVLSDRVTLTWLSPTDTGGRTDVLYSVVCDACPPAVTYAPMQTGLTVTRVSVFGLSSSTTYNFSVFSTNGVTKMSLLAAMPAIAVVTTTSSGSAAAGSFALLVPQSNSTAITFSWMPTPYADMYAITYRTADSTVVKVVNSTSESVTIFGLKPAMIYYFKVASYSGGQLVSSSQEVAFSTTSEPTATATTTVIVVAVVAVIVGMGIVFVIVVIIMVTLARRGEPGDSRPVPMYSNESKDDLRSSNGEPQSSCATVYKLIHSILSTRGCCSKTKQANYGASQPWRTTSSALAGSSSSTAAITGMLGRSVEALAAASAAAAAADRPAPQSPVTPSVPPFDGPSAAPLFPSSVMGVTAGSIRGRPGKTYVDPHLYEDPRNAVREFARELDPSCITIESVIGGGEFGDVCRGILRLPGSSDAIVAIKTLKGGASEKSRLDFLTEASIMGQFSDPNIIFLEGVVTKANPIMIVTEFMENGSLDTFLRANDGCLSLGQLLNMLRGIASGMHYLSEMSYVHRDLAARNILVSATLVCKVADFGLSREVEYNESEGAYTTRGGKIPVRWTAPEAIAYRKFTTASDVWSYGVVMWEVMSYGERPYWNWSNHDVIKAVEQDYRLPAPMDCPAAIHQLMLRCWQRERGLRPRFAAIVQVLDNLSRSKDLLPPPAPSVPSIVDLYDLQPVDFPGQAGTAQPHVALRSVLNAIGMECYYAHFVAHGYVTFERLATLTSSALEAIGVSNDEHRSSIVATVQRLARQTVCQRTFNGASTAAATTSSAGFLV